MAEIAAVAPSPITSSFKWANDGGSVHSLSPKYILSEDKRPNIDTIPSAPVPSIDLSQPEEVIIKDLLEACDKYGIFYLVNHGVDPELCQRALDAIVEFFHLPAEKSGRAKLQTTDFKQDVKIFKYHEPDGDKQVPGWSEALTHLWHATDESFLDALPDHPPQYREIIREYAKEIGTLFDKVFGWLSVGLGLEKDTLMKEMGDKPFFRKMQANFYPPCPNPELTLGLPVHNDMAALAIIRQTENVTGLHIIRDDKWMAVQPVPNSFVCNVGDVLEILSNGRFKSVRHRAVTSKDKTRVSLASFIAPNKQTVLSPVKDLIDENNPPNYETFLYANFHERILRPWLHANH